MKLQLPTPFSQCLALSIGISVVQAAVVAYPQKGQSSEQQMKDKAECGQCAEQLGSIWG